jgi:hypothetical protein
MHERRLELQGLDEKGGFIFSEGRFLVGRGVKYFTSRFLTHDKYSSGPYVLSCRNLVLDELSNPILGSATNDIETTSSRVTVSNNQEPSTSSNDDLSDILIPLLTAIRNSIFI